MLAVDGTFNSLSEATYADIPLTTIIALGNGNHTIYVHGKDAAGNWGCAASSTTLVIDKIPPAIQSITRSDPNPTSAASVPFLVTFSEAVNGITAANLGRREWNRVGRGGDHVGDRVRRDPHRDRHDRARRRRHLRPQPHLRDGHHRSGRERPRRRPACPLVGQVYTQPSPPLYFSTAGNTNPPGVAGTADDADIYIWNGTAFSRTIDVTAITNPLPAGANVDGFDRVDATHFYLSFNGAASPCPGSATSRTRTSSSTTPAPGRCTSTAASTASRGTDLDAISIVGGHAVLLDRQHHRAARRRRYR